MESKILTLNVHSHLLLLPHFQIVIIYDCFVLFLSFISAFITLVMIKGAVATLHAPAKGVSGVMPVNLGFIGGYLAFFNLYVPQPENSEVSVLC